MKSLKKICYLHLIGTVGALLPMTSAFSFCGITTELAQHIGLNSNCIYENNLKGAPAACNDVIDVSLGIEKARLEPVLDNSVQPEGSLLSPLDIVKGTSILNGFSGAILRCNYGSARTINIYFEKASPEPGISAKTSSYSTAGIGEPADIGVSLKAQGKNFPGTATTENTTSFAPPGTAVGTLEASTLPNILSIQFKRLLNQSGNKQKGFGSNTYIQMVFRYYPIHGNSTTPAYLRINLKAFPNESVGQQATCGVSVANPNVELGNTTPMALKQGDAPIVPFQFTYVCDGSPTAPFKVGLQPAGTTSAFNEKLLHSTDSTAKGVGLAFSDKPGNDFTPLPWLDKSVCANATLEGFCDPNPAKGNNVGTAGWLPIPTPLESGNVQTLYARMMALGNVEPTGGDFNASVNVLVTHD